MKSTVIDIEVSLVHQTSEAVKVTTGEAEDAVWLPKSAIEIERNENSKLYTVTLPESMALDKGLI